MMDRKKYIVEASDDVKKVMAMGVTHGGAIWTDTTDIENLEELNSDYINEHFGDLQDDAYNKGYAQCHDDYSDALKHAKDTAYKKGFEDGKAVNDKGCVGCKFEGNGKDHSPCDYCCNRYSNQWQAKTDDEIKVGDEVIYNGTTKCIVVRPEDDERYASLIDSDGTHYSADHRECEKTGRHFDIDKFLEEMRT